MGTFGGHVLPGSFFIIYGLWSIWHILVKFYRRKIYELNPTSYELVVPEYQCRISNPMEKKTLCCYCSSSGSIPLDSSVKLICCIIGIIGEVITGFNNEWIFVHIGNAQHSTMFSLFGLSGIIELCIFYKILKIPIQCEYLFHGIALLGELFLFVFHLHHRSVLDVYLHLLLTSMIILGILVSMIELLKSNEPIYGLLRSWTYLMQGTWFCQVGAILYPKTSWMPIWDQQANQSRSAAANLFCYHMLGNFIVILLIMTILFRHYTKIGLINNVDEKTLRITLSHSKYHQQPLQNSQSLLEKQQQTFIIDNHSEQIELCNSNYSNTIETNEIDQNEQDQ